MIFDLLNNTTVDKIKIRTISIHTIGYKKTNFTIVLTCMTDRIKLSPLVIFKLKKILKENFLSEVIVYANPTG